MTSRSRHLSFPIPNPLAIDFPNMQPEHAHPGKQPPGPPSPSAAALFQQAMEASSQGRPEIALARLDQAVERAPSALAIRLQGVLMLEMLDRRHEAQKRIGKIISLAPGSAAAWFVAGRILLSLEDNDQAAALLEHCRRLAPKNADLWRLLAAVYRRRDQPARELFCLRRATEATPDSSDSWFQLGIAQHGRRDLHAAARSFRQVAEIKPRHQGAHFNLGAVLRFVGDEAGAARHIRLLLSIQPDNSSALMRLGRLLNADRRTGAAQRLFERALVLEPFGVEPRSLLGSALWKTDRKRAGRLFVEAIALSPADDGAYYEFGSLLAGAEPVPAAHCFGRCLAANPKRHDALLALSALTSRVPVHLLKPVEQLGEGYRNWTRDFDTIDPVRAETIKARLKELRLQPSISIILPVHDPEPAYLKEAIQSVEEQLYDRWQLCIADDGSRDPEVRRLIAEADRRDSRIRTVRLDRSRHISEASNAALDLATGDLVTFLDHDDVLRPHALYMVAAALADDPELGLIYSDEDKIDAAGRRYMPHFKPDWNPEMILRANYVCHLAAYRRDLVEKVGRLRIGLEGSQDHDLVLRVSALLTPDRIHHIPHILYHWRAVPGSTAHNVGAKPYVREATARAVGDFLRAAGDDPILLRGKFGVEVRHKPPDPLPAVTVIVPTKDRERLLRRCVESLEEGTQYPDLHLVLVDNGTTESAATQYLRELEQGDRATVLRRPGPFNFSTLCNDAASLAKTPLLLFLNNDIEALEGTWLREMVAELMRPGIGVVGARLLYPDRKVQHAGVHLAGDEGAVHVHRLLEDDDVGYMGRAGVTQRLSAVTGACMLVRRDAFQAIGGFDTGFAVNYNDIDFCLRATDAGWATVWTPAATLLHRESASRGTFLTPKARQTLEVELTRFTQRWGERLYRDPAGNPNLALGPDFHRLARPPRVPRPWE